jgi:hypothetical protein
MQPEAAEKLTVEIANRANPAEKTLVGNDLPKIDGRPAPPPPLAQAKPGAR